MMQILTKKRGHEGFTLIELLVIAIIGVLASIVLASLNNARRKSRDARRITDVKQIQLALELYFDGVGAGAYPVSTRGDVGACANTGNANGLEGLVTNNYIPSVPRDPNSTTASAVCYDYADRGTTYHLATTLEDSANPALPGKDCNSSVVDSCGTGAVYNKGYDGAVAKVYDLIP